MRKKKCIWAIILMLLFAEARSQEGYPYRQVPFSDVKFNDEFWSAFIKKHIDRTIPSAIVQVRDSTARISNFEVAAGVKEGKYQGLVWDDSDVYKVMEGMAYSLHNAPDPELEKLLDYWIDVMAKAQLPDGYLNTFYILKKEDDGLGKNLGRWSDMGRHEMYCAGHMIEAAIAYKKATGKTKFLEVARKFADHLMDTFGPGKRRWVPLHQEIELALVKLYYATGEKKYAEFARWLFEERGRGIEVGPMWDNGPPRKAIDCQTDIPVAEITEAWGHAVRAMYMYSGMLDVVVSLRDSTYLPAVNRVWENAIPAKMYITGGIGSRHQGEAFGAQYELPNKEAYCETCSSVGMVLWNNRMSLMYGDAKYADVVERVMYNAAIAGVSLSGDKFFYTNPLASEGKNHRGEKYGIACCPSNMARFLPSLGNYVYMANDNELFVNLYTGSDARLQLGSTPVTLTQKTNYPWDGKVTLTVNPETPVQGKLHLRIPDWCKSYSIRLNGKKNTGAVVNKGYAVLDREWKKGDAIILDMEMPVEIVYPAPQIKHNIGRIAVQRGPLVYCVEQVDNPGVDLDNLQLGTGNAFKIKKGEGVLEGIRMLQTKSGNNTITLIPYYAWENRESGKMQVWIKHAK